MSGRGVGAPAVQAGGLVWHPDQAGGADCVSLGSFLRRLSLATVVFDSDYSFLMLSSLTALTSLTVGAQQA